MGDVGLDGDQVKTREALEEAAKMVRGFRERLEGVRAEK